MGRASRRERVRGELRDIEKRLDAAYGAGTYPKSLVVDLHDLLGTMEKAVATINSLMEADTSVDGLRDGLYSLEIMVEDDIPMIVADVLPVLKRLHGTDDEDGS